MTNGRGEPVLTCNRYGKGLVYFSTVSAESETAARPGVMDTPAMELYAKIYELVGARALAVRAAAKSHPAIGLTEHVSGDGRHYVAAVNYSTATVEAPFTLRRGGGFQVLYGDADTLAPGAGVIVELT